ncbi:Arc family DNA-binding protein [Luteibacter sp. E-22]|uniref:Arc family DNA-binding protein n=1 Tax=Luteibacter sp. E-22 TaxID=3404050 RepID=UPI003CEBA1CE
MGPTGESSVRAIDVQLKVRLPAALKSWLKGRASRNDRSQNAEVVQILKKEMERCERRTRKVA